MGLKPRALVKASTVEDVLVAIECELNVNSPQGLQDYCVQDLEKALVKIHPRGFVVELRKALSSLLCTSKAAGSFLPPALLATSPPHPLATSSPRKLAL
jgi:hypothetical protein